MWKNKKASWQNSPIKCCLSAGAAPVLGGDWLRLACRWGGAQSSPVEMGGIFLRRIDAAIVSSASIELFKSKNCTLGEWKSCKNTWRPVGGKKIIKIFKNFKNFAHKSTIVKHWKIKPYNHIFVHSNIFFHKINLKIVSQLKFVNFQLSNLSTVFFSNILSPLAVKHLLICYIIINE